MNERMRTAQSQVLRSAQGMALSAGLLGCAVIAVTVPNAEVAAVGAKKSVTASTATAITSPASTAPAPETTGVLHEQRLSSPDRVVVRDDLGPVATFTVGSGTVALRRPQRTSAELTTTARVTTTWVRLLAQPFTGTVDYGWLTARMGDTSDDVLDLARQYVTGAPERRDASGLRIAGDASYGPLRPDGTRVEGSDFEGLPWWCVSSSGPPFRCGRSVGTVIAADGSHTQAGWKRASTVVDKGRYLPVGCSARIAQHIRQEQTPVS